MRKKIIALLFVFAFMGVSTMALMATAKTTAPAIDYGPEVIDATPEMLGEDEIAMRKRAAEVGAAVATGASLIGDPAYVGDNFTIGVSDFMYGDYDENFTVVIEGVHGIILVETDAVDNYDAVTDEYVFANPSGTWRPEDRISTAMLTYLLGQFDSNIYPAVTGVFGDLLARGDEGQKVWVLIHNIRDEAYYGDFEYYVAGYFSSSENAENNKNMFHIDSYDWQNRVGPDGGRPHLYEGTFAHEFEHMVHFDVDPDEPSWVDEGLADLASYLSGYGHSDGHIDYYFRRHMSTPLTFWGGGLEDYGASYLFQLYLFEKFGGAEFISALVNEQANGIEGIENTLADFGFTESFDEIFDAWTIANYVDDSKKAGGKYGYETLEIGGTDTRGNTIEDSIQAAHQFWKDDLGLWIDVFPFYETPFVDTWWQFHPYLYGDPLPYTAQYFRFYSQDAANVWLDGQESTGILPVSGTYEWFSSDNAWAWRSFYQTFPIPTTGATLNFMTWFQIEDDWDYGYVEVHDLTTDEWVTLNDPSARMWVYNESTFGYDYVPMRTFVLNAQNNPNTPDGLEPTDYEAVGTWFGFTGDSDGWIPVSMDLTPFSGHPIELHFRLWQDGAFSLLNMFIDDISITGPEIEFFDDVESGDFGWLTDGWAIMDGIFPNGWGMTVFNFKAKNKGMELGGIWRMEVDYATQDGVVSVPATPHNSGRMSVAVVANYAKHKLTNYYAMGADLK